MLPWSRCLDEMVFDFQPCGQPEQSHKDLTNCSSGIPFRMAGLYAVHCMTPDVARYGPCHLAHWHPSSTTLKSWELASAFQHLWGLQRRRCVLGRYKVAEW